MYAKNIIVQRKSRYKVEEWKITQSSNSMEIVVNDKKIKYIVMTRITTVKSTLSIEILTFKQVRE